MSRDEMMLLVKLSRRCVEESRAELNKLRDELWRTREFIERSRSRIWWRSGAARAMDVHLTPPES
jgi:hypothetical protein